MQVLSKFIFTSALAVAVSGAAIGDITAPIESASSAISSVVSVAVAPLSAIKSAASDVSTTVVASASNSAIEFATTVTVAAPTETTVVTLMPLPSPEAKKQEQAFSKAQKVPNAAASQVTQILKTAGKIAPSAIVPDQPKQTEVKHSGLNDIVNILEHTDYSRPVNDEPLGFAIKNFNGTDFDVADDYAKRNKARLPIAIANLDSFNGMCIQGHAMNTASGEVIPFTLNNTKSSQIYIAPNSTVLISNYLPLGDNNHNGRIQPSFNCNKDCTKCAGDSQGPIKTLFETNHRQFADGKFFSNFNPSHVDGLSGNFNVTVFNMEGGVCKTRACDVSAKRIKEVCPKASLWTDKGVFGCKSDCKVTGRDDHCCVGQFGLPTTCPPSSQFLHELCSDAYSWPYDDKEHSDTCDRTGKIHIAFWPISK